MLVRVDTVKTSQTSAEMAEALIRAWIKQFQTTPKKESIAVLYAQNYLETGGTAHQYNWNLGNIKAFDDKNPNTVIKYHMLNNVWEIGKDGKKYVYNPPDPQTWFRAFDSLDDGAEFYILFLKNNRYKVCWEAILNGDPEKFAILLKQQGYYTANVNDYIHLMKYGFNFFMKSDYYEKTINSLKENAEYKNIIDNLYYVMPDIDIKPNFDAFEDSKSLEKPKSLISNVINSIRKLF